MGTTGEEPAVSERSAGGAPELPKKRLSWVPQITDASRRKVLAGAYDVGLTGAQAERYDAVRPTYPDAVVRTALAGGGEDVTVVELGAGTGLLTHELVAAGARVHAVEPSQAMLEVLQRKCSRSLGAESGSSLSTHIGTAEDTGVESGIADAVVVAQAWHWFDEPAALKEIERLLRPGGRLTIVSNHLDTSVPWVHRLARIMRAGDIYRPQWVPELPRRVFLPVQREEERWSRTVTVEFLFSLAESMSSWLTAAQADQQKRRENLRWYLEEHLECDRSAAIQLPYITVTITADRKPEG